MATQISRSMISETSICNQALSFIGGNQIDSLEENSTDAEWCRNNYQFVRDAVIEERMWTFATVRAISTVADTPEWGEGLFVHPTPIDWLQVFRVYCDERQSVVEWYKEGTSVLAASDTVYMWGVRRITDTGKFSNMFVQCLAARLAAVLAIPLAQDKKLKEDMWNLYYKLLGEAALRDGMQGRNEKIRSGRLVGVRRSGNIGSRYGQDY